MKANEVTNQDDVFSHREYDVQLAQGRNDKQ